MKGYIYIARWYETVNINSTSRHIDNDPHLWTAPPTWGICRTEYRKNVNSGDYVFFVLPKYSEYGHKNQIIFAYLEVARTITHLQAYTDCPHKRMQAGGQVNGNIIVNSDDSYSRYDLGAHRDKFKEIKDHYVVGNPANSELLTEEKLKRLAPNFRNVLNDTFNTVDKDVFQVISRKGRKLNAEKIFKLLDFLRE